MKTLKIIKKQGPHRPSTSEISKKVNLFLNKPSERLSLKELRQIKSLLRYLRARLKHSYFEGLCQFKYDNSNLLDIIKPSKEYDRRHQHLGESVSKFLIRYCNDTSTLLTNIYTEEYICYKYVTQDVVYKIVDWALTRGRGNKSGMTKATIYTYISYIRVALKHALDSGRINDERPLEYLSFNSLHQRLEDKAIYRPRPTFRKQALKNSK